MKVIYTAPNRGHHFIYASALNARGCLHAFVSGYPRISPYAKVPGLKGKLYRADILQTLYIGGLKSNFPTRISQFFNYLAKVEQDYACRKWVKNCDIFLFYNGCGLTSSRYGRKNGVISIVEAVNSHVEYQEEILEQEYKNLNLPWRPFPKNDKRRRLKEYEEADYILMPSEFVKRSFIAKGFPEKKLLKVAYGFNKLGSINCDINVSKAKETFTVLYVGSISLRKGIRYLIEAFKMLNHPNKKLVLVGPNINDGALKGITLTQEIIFTGILKGKQLEDAYKSADVFCLPTIEEGLALVLGEALSYGLPIIATSNSGADDLIKDGNEGFIVPIRDSKSIWQKLQSLVDNPELLNQIRGKASSKSEDLNGWEKTGDKLVDALYNVYLQK